jgi:LmbE family N-acetylglucosaminyl deacetylase
LAELVLEASRFTRVLVIGAHPDDAEYFAGGTLARLVELGAHVALVVCTDGSRGGRGLDDVARVRAEEQARAAEILGFGTRANLGRIDGELANDDALRAELVLALRRQRPELVLAHDPRTLWNVYGGRAHPGHSDHRAAGQAALDAVYPRAASPNFYPGQLAESGVAPWYPREVWLFDTAQPDVHVDVKSSFARKLDALRAHVSQNGDDGLIRGARALGEVEPFARLVLRKLRSPHEEVKGVDG